MSDFLLPLSVIDRSDLPLVGGKGASLGELSRLDGIQVPAGFCVTTEAFRRVLRQVPDMDRKLDRLAQIPVANRAKIARYSAEIRQAIEGILFPEDLAAETARHWNVTGASEAYAVRSSATAEDLPTASFAGQQDTFLNIIGLESILWHIRKCWASLFTERAVIYRNQTGFGHRDIQLAVVVQKMIFPEVSGVLFTADPVSGNRKISAIDAVFGLGEALVSGAVNADHFQVRDGELISRKIAAQTRAIISTPGGGTSEKELPSDQQIRPALTDSQAVGLSLVGRKIEAFFGHPQDIEWCLADGVFYIVQSRPITTLFPIPETTDQTKHVYLSVGHQQMMTDAMKPLGISVWQMTAARPMPAAGGRLFVDITRELASPATRNLIVNVLGKSDPLIRSALLVLLERGDIVGTTPEEVPQATPKSSVNYQARLTYDPTLVPDLIGRFAASLEKLKQDIQKRSGADLFDFLRKDIAGLTDSLKDPQSMEVIMTAMNASSQLNEKIQEWLGERNVADTLTLSVPNNVTSDMGLELVEVADAVRPFPEVVAYLRAAEEAGFWEGFAGLEGGEKASASIRAFLDRYGMRCAGEIDITRPRWSEKPTALTSVILGNIANLEPGAGRKQQQQGIERAATKEKELIARLTGLPDGKEKAEEVSQLTELIREYSGYREYPKYHIVCRYLVYKKALMKEAGKLAEAGILPEKEDAFFLSFDELEEAVQMRYVSPELLIQRKEAFRREEKQIPPRVMTSDGEMFNGSYRHESLPPEALPGLAVSAGVVEGRARVLLNLENADLEAGDILVTTFTDPGWTPLFVSAKGLVTEVGGLMTHGAVIAREYGLPAVVAVEGATRLIRDGQRIRVNGTDGYVELL